MKSLKINVSVTVKKISLQLFFLSISYFVTGSYGRSISDTISFFGKSTQYTLHSLY